MKQISLLIIAIMASMVINAQDIDKSALRQAIERQLATYPKSQLQDIYKAFYQEHFGAEHMITDKEAARNYLDQELATMQDKRDGIYVEPIGMSGDYVRVYLIAVSHKILSSSQLLKAFIESAGDHKSPTISWTTKWQAIVEVVDEVSPGLGSDDERAMLLQASLNNQAVHHSQAYNAAYHPHYRIVTREIFEKMLKNPEVATQPR